MSDCSGGVIWFAWFRVSYLWPMALRQVGESVRNCERLEVFLNILSEDVFVRNSVETLSPVCFSVLRKSSGL